MGCKDLREKLIQEEPSYSLHLLTFVPCIHPGTQVPDSVSRIGAAAGSRRGECVGCQLKVVYVAFINADKKLPKAMAGENKTGLKKPSKFAHWCFVQLAFLEQAVVLEMPVQKTLPRRISGSGYTACYIHSLAASEKQLVEA